jgi:hypothetical protein
VHSLAREPGGIRKKLSELPVRSAAFTMVDTLVSAGALGSLVHANSTADFEYLGFYAASE